MPFALVIIGLVMIVTGAKDTYREFGAEIVSDFTGPGNFTYWIASIGAVGAIGYIPAFQKPSRLFLGLIIIAMLLSNRGFFAKLSASINAGPQNIEATPRVPDSTPSGQQVNTSQGFTIPPLSQQNANAQSNFNKVVAAAKQIIPLFLGA